MTLSKILDQAACLLSDKKDELIRVVREDRLLGVVDNDG